MSSELTLAALVVGAVVYQATVIVTLSLWLFRQGFNVPRTVSIGRETKTEKYRMAAVCILFWLAVILLVVTV